MSKQQIELGLGEQFTKKRDRSRGEWLQAFYKKAYAEGKEAGKRELEKHFRDQIRLLELG